MNVNGTKDTNSGTGFYIESRNSDELLVCLHKARQEIRDKAIDLEWQGLPADNLWKTVESMTERIENGEQYEVLF
jgi:hypothetical protein|tara:strand:+ start:851 stop:1075 length:225 start_codon:yes stop_codon:yes gene_type:complete